MKHPADKGRFLVRYLGLWMVCGGAYLSATEDHSVHPVTSPLILNGDALPEWASLKRRFLDVELITAYSVLSLAVWSATRDSADAAWNDSAHKYEARLTEATWKALKADDVCVGWWDQWTEQSASLWKKHKNFHEFYQELYPRVKKSYLEHPLKVRSLASSLSYVVSTNHDLFQSDGEIVHSLREPWLSHVQSAAVFLLKVKRDRAYFTAARRLLSPKQTTFADAARSLGGQVAREETEQASKAILKYLLRDFLAIDHAGLLGSKGLIDEWIESESVQNLLNQLGDGQAKEGALGRLFLKHGLLHMYREITDPLIDAPVETLLAQKNQEDSALKEWSLNQVQADKTLVVGGPISRGLNPWDYLRGIRDKGPQLAYRFATIPVLSVGAQHVVQRWLTLSKNSSLLEIIVYELLQSFLRDGVQWSLGEVASWVSEGEMMLSKPLGYVVKGGVKHYVFEVALPKLEGHDRIIQALFPGLPLMSSEQVKLAGYKKSVLIPISLKDHGVAKLWPFLRYILKTSYDISVHTLLGYMIRHSAGGASEVDFSKTDFLKSHGKLRLQYHMKNALDKMVYTRWIGPFMGSFRWWRTPKGWRDRVKPVGILRDGGKYYYVIP